MNSSTLQAKFQNPDSRTSRLAKSAMPHDELIHEIYFATFGRPPDPTELGEAIRFFETQGTQRQAAIEDLTWALINSAEFVFNH